VPVATTLALVVLAALLYATGTRELWRRGGRGSGVRPWQAVAFAAGLAAVAAAVAPPLDGLAHELFSAHMLQHLLLLLVAAPLLALGRPLLPLLWALPPAWRRRLGPLVSAGRRLAGTASWPLVTIVLHAGVVWAWHVPILYEAALASPAVHALEHATMLGTALLFWSAVVASGAHGRLGQAAAVLVVFGTAVQSGGLGALLTFARSPLYPTHEAAALARGADPLADQQLAGLLMWIPGGMVYIGAAALLLLLGLRAVERRAVARGLGGTALLLAVVLAASGCRHVLEQPPEVTEGNPNEGRRLIQDYGCGACHVIPGVRGADSLVAPPLTSFARRSFVGGRLANSPENLARWIENPQEIAPGTAMPNLGVSELEARDIAAYLFTLR
jgi:putative membrane protein